MGGDEIPPDQVEEARLVQLEQLRRFHLRGTLPDYTEDTEDLELLIEITADRTRFAQVCDDWRWAVENPPRRLDLAPGAVRIRKPSMSGSLTPECWGPGRRNLVNNTSSRCNLGWVIQRAVGWADTTSRPPKRPDDLPLCEPAHYGTTHSLELADVLARDGFAFSISAQNSSGRSDRRTILSDSSNVDNMSAASSAPTSTR